MSLYRQMAQNGQKWTTITEIITKDFLERLNSNEFKVRSRKSNRFFTRNRKMTFQEVITFVPMSLKNSTNTALRRFFKAIGSKSIMKQQSFSEARAKIKPEAFIELFQLTVPPLMERCRETWNGYRAFAIDGSKIALPTDDVLAKDFGVLGKNGTAPTAQGSILYDVLNDIIVDAAIEPLPYDERTLANWHINRLVIDVLPDDSNKLLLFDRGYPSFDLIEKLENDELYYVMRVKRKFNLDIDAQNTPDGYVTLYDGKRSVRVRVIKFLLPSGEEEVLITNVTDKRLGVNAFKKLYFLRWPVETKYEILKNRFSIESFSSRTSDNVKQDFWATITLANIVSATVHDAQSIVDYARAGKENKYQYRPNINEAIAILKDDFVYALTLDDNYERQRIIRQVISQIASYARPVRPNRSKPRKNPRNSRFNHNRKFNC